ncbi:MAG: alpha/beta fold hydrolase [Mariniblastus sp.]|nr:alpha/beta fold hydrolase [Mariniblastus sp.]
MEIASGPPFKPLRFMRDPHLQTIAAVFLRGQADREVASRQVVNLSDADRLVVHDNVPERWNPGSRIAILMHGLCGSHASPYMVRTARKLRALGVRTVRVDFRGQGDSALISQHHLHAGCSQDLRDVVQHVHRASPASPVSLVGFSLGGSILLKALGEWSSDGPGFVDSAVAVSPPVDLAWSCANLQFHGNRIYDYYFVRTIKQNLAVRRRRVAGLVDNHVHPLPHRLVHFDDQFTGPVWGFRGARDYYEQCSSGPLLGQVRVPTVILASRDDPVVPFEMYSHWPMSPQIRQVTTRYGGHLGFLGRAGPDPDGHWMDWRICDWIGAAK